MEILSEDTLKQLLTKEWLVKIDTLKSIPYLIKFYASPDDLTCCVLITDTKSVWAEGGVYFLLYIILLYQVIVPSALSGPQFSRRWREVNGLEPISSSSSIVGEEEWRAHTLELLSNAHSLGGFTDLSFEVVETNFSDVACTLEDQSFKWRWESCFLGYRASAEILSKHLVLPLISMSHLAFSSKNSVGEVSDAELTKAVDKVGRTARRNVDIHIKNTISKPRIATVLRRITAMFNFASDLPIILTSAEKPEFEILPPPSSKQGAKSHSPQPARTPSPITIEKENLKTSSKSISPDRTEADVRQEGPESDSATDDSDDEEENSMGKGKGKAPLQQPDKSRSPIPTPAKKRPTQLPSSDTDSSPVRPQKKLRLVAAHSYSVFGMDEQRSFNGADESLLEAALNQAFTPPPRRDSTGHAGHSTSRDDAEVTAADTASASKSSEPLVSSEVLESWKSEYESQVETWRSQSAEAREKAERERARWEGVRAKERESSLQDSNEGWERVGSKGNSLAPSSVSGLSSSVADSGRDIVTSELPAAPHDAGPAPPPSQSEDSQKWEDVPTSLTSSFPSMSFPEHTENSSPARLRSQDTKVPVSATLAIFDSSLSTRTRVKALFSSLAINFLLPFVNGVMLGFGEIFAKNIVLEWWRPGSSATMTGVRGGQTFRTRRT
ncbi:uncharacterized protein ARMOST_12974 [Armillaria ostoyae]|uniref:Uncharacterized protein n=1 Tax=Armillaria ostoyae TaxID=47428 RepID=A0A284RLI0_ARMOS|nr:uncharacterized protein ARMOST_12974 [Armillaria ostoyae]